MSTSNNIIKVDLSIVSRAIRLCFIANIPVATWGRRGVGKSSVFQQAIPKGWGYYDFRTSDKEGQDVGGLPFPVERKVNGKIIREVEYLMTRLLPFDREEKCVVVFEEFDRADLSVQNPCLQLLLDRTINGHRLSPGARLGVTGNAGTDFGTTPLSKAAAGRMCHLYVETEGDGALNSWLNWAREQQDTELDPFGAIPPELQSFAKYNQDVWCDTSDVGQLEEYGSPTARTFVSAGKLWRASKKATFETADVILPVLAGCVGTVGAHKLIGWFELEAKAPKIEDILEDPKKARLPDDHQIYFALGLTIARYTKSAMDGQADKLATYVARWPDEQARFAFTHMLNERKQIATSEAYLKWEKSL